MVSSGAGVACQFSPASVRVGELKIEYLRGGKGAPLLYLHGLSRPLGWDTDHIGLALHRSVFAPVFPGWKAGRLPIQITSVKDYARLMLAFIDAEKMAKLDLIGHSFGGWVALYLALLAPGRIERLILVDSMGLDPAECSAVDISEFDDTALYEAAFAARGILVAAGDFGGVPVDLRSGALFKSLLNGQRNLITLTEGKCGEGSLSPLLDKIETKTLIVWGETDRITPVEHASEFSSHLRRSQLAIIKGAGHLPQKEKPQTFLRVVCDFLMGKQESLEGVINSATIKEGEQ
jgi:pimeloyl-ACP methyl ester carboxylesterase